MKRFIYKNIVFGIVVIFVITLNGILGISESLYYRHWERSYSSMSNSGHLENYDEEMLTIGDLAFSNYSVPTNYNYIPVQFSTDEFGFRNLSFNRNPDVVILGDSNSFGSRISDEQTFSNILNEKGFNVLNLSGIYVRGFLKMVELGIIEKPKKVVLCQIERNIGLDFILGDWKFRKNHLRSFPTINKVLTSSFNLTFINFMKSRIFNLLKRDNKEIYKDEILFLNGFNPNRSDVKLSVKNILLVKELLNREEMELLYVTIPDKETFYGLVNDDFISQVNHELLQNGIKSLNPIESFRSSEIEPYFKDDSHMNLIGHEIISNLILQEIERDISLVD